MWCEYFFAGSLLVYTASGNTYMDELFIENICTKLSQETYLFSRRTGKTWWALCRQTEGDLPQIHDAQLILTHMCSQLHVSGKPSLSVQVKITVDIS